MLKDFKEILMFISHFSLVLVQCIAILNQAVTSQAENREPLKKISIVIMPESLLETNGFRIR